MFLIDTHTHIYLPEFDDDRDEVIERAKQAGIGKLLMPNVDETTLVRLHQAADRWPDYCLPMIGLHPTSVNQSTTDQPKWVEEGLKTGQYIAIGEVGLDLYWDRSHESRQVEVFRYQIELALKYNMPLVIHSREATGLILEILAGFNPCPRGVLHCFSGTADEAIRAVELGLMLGIGGVFTFKKSTLPEIVKLVGMENILLETDAPYLSPVPHRGKRNEPSYLKLVAGAMAATMQTTTDEVAAITTANADRLFSIL